jgi:hypothetical protein
MDIVEGGVILLKERISQLQIHLLIYMLASCVTCVFNTYALDRRRDSEAAKGNILAKTTMKGR